MLFMTPYYTKLVLRAVEKFECCADVAFDGFVGQTMSYLQDKQVVVGDLINNTAKLKALLVKIKYDQPLNEELYAPLLLPPLLRDDCLIRSVILRLHRSAFEREMRIRCCKFCVTRSFACRLPSRGGCPHSRQR
jgi:hypothetical protein